MRGICGRRLVLGLATLVAGSCLTGCGGGGGGAFEFFGSPFTTTGTTTTTTTGPTTTGRQTGGSLGTGVTGFTDPCLDSAQAHKFVRISMRNLSPDFIHYFLVMIAFVNGTTYPSGGVCQADVPLYTAFGYNTVADGSSVEFGNVCIRGPALYYFHRNGQFQVAGGTSGASLGSAIAPAQGTTATFDAFFSSSGALVPIPDQILFQNPGTSTGGQSLKVSVSNPSPCNAIVITGVSPDCEQDSFYYVDENDRLVGSTALGIGSGRRVPSEIQGTGCQCRGLNQPYQSIAPQSETAANAQCNEFFRGGRIDFAFVRDDTEPPFPQLLWRVADSSGDPRARFRFAGEHPLSGF